MNREIVIPTGNRIGGAESDLVTVEPVRAFTPVRFLKVRAFTPVWSHRRVLSLPRGGVKCSERKRNSTGKDQ